MIRSSSHSLKFTNGNKLSRYLAFIAEYRRVGQFIVDDIWANGYGSFNIHAEELDFPKYLDYNKFNIKTALSARALSSLVTQVSSVIRASVAKRKRQIYWEDKSGQLVKKSQPLVKPSFLNARLELSSKCVDIKASLNTFDYFIRIKSIGTAFGQILIPVKATKVSNKWNALGKLLGGVLLGNADIQLRFEVKRTNKADGLVVGADQGINAPLTLSNGIVSGLIDNHGHTLNKLTCKMSRKLKGSKAFKRARIHRDNFVNWSINQLDLSGVKEIRLEKIVNIRYQKRTNRFLSHFSNPMIRDKVKRYAEEREVLVTEQDSAYRSQRCSNCGLVRKANRKGKDYSCKVCKLSIDADLNAAKNHTIDLLPISLAFRMQRNNLGAGFYWNPGSQL